MQQDFPFQPAGMTGNAPNGTSIAVTTAIQNFALPPTGSDGGSMRLVNNGNSAISWCYGSSTGLTAINGVVMLPNSVETFSLPGGISTLSVIGAAVGSTLSAAVGQGT
ncbi:MAG TPA: hypothetical protein VN815_18930 [Steroidobacteraceae bacterium]|nr:hypothetical protein [Steroidobacteraceae bacterium]